MEEINSLSLFNGMGCLWIALEMCDIKVNKAYSSEIEKFPIKANDAMFPNTEQIGDVRNVDVSKLEYIHLLAGGSPCQSFSFAGKRKGMAAKEKIVFIPPTEEEYFVYLKNAEFEPDYEDYIEECRVQHEIKHSDLELIEILTLEHYLQLKEEGFEFEGQSYLFWEYIRILTDIKKYNPDVRFLLENVIMGKKWQKIITQAIGINPIRINASLVSAQNRDRLFWTNIFTEQDGFFGDLKCAIPQPKDEGILLKDVLETFETSKFGTREEFDDYMKKYCLSENTLKRLDLGNIENAGQISFSTKGVENKKATALLARDYKGISGKQGFNIVAMRGRNPENPKSRKSGLPTEQQLEPRFDGKTNCLTTVQKDNLVMGCDYRTDEGLRIRSNGKSGTLAARARNDESCGQLAIVDQIIRRLTTRECGRLQSVPEHLIDIMLNAGISDTQLYKMFGNGWNCKVIAWILKHLKL